MLMCGEHLVSKVSFAEVAGGRAAESKLSSEVTVC
jgi:hypothetical protein